MEDCVFCKIVAGDIPAQKIYEDENYLAFLNIAPNTKGHSLVIPKKHTATFLDLNSDEAGELNKIVLHVAKKLTKALNIENFNLGLNNGAIAGQSVQHVHWHLIPRYEGDGLLHWEKSPKAGEELDQVFALFSKENN